MTFRGSAAVLALLLAASAARAQATTTEPRTTDITARTGVKPMERFGWAGIGMYSGFGGTDFGLNAGAAMNVAPLAPDVPLAIFGNIGLGFDSGGTFFPLTAGAAVHYDKLPVALFGGAGLTIVPHTGGGTTPIGLGILLMGLLPLPQLAPNLSGEAQLQWHILSDSASFWALTVGLGYAF